MQKPKIKLQIVIFLEFWVVYTVSFFVSNPLYVNKEQCKVKTKYKFDVLLRVLLKTKLSFVGY